MATLRTVHAKAHIHSSAAVKRQTSIDRALAKFAEHPYAVASLSWIVTRAGIETYVATNEAPVH
jgi:hypothetical protein